METSLRVKRRRFIVGAVVAIFLLAGGIGIVIASRPSSSLVDADQRTTAAIVVAVTTERVTQHAVQRSIKAVGSLYGEEELKLSPKVEGRIIKVYHGVGDVIAPGTKLLEINPIDYELAVEVARKALELELAWLGVSQLPAGKLDVTQHPTVLRAAAQERNATLKRERMKRIAANSGAASVEDMDQAETDLVVAKTNYRQSILEAESRVATARYRQALLNYDLQRLKDTTIVAPPAPEGTRYVICERPVSEGEMVRISPGDESVMFRMLIDRTLKLKVMVPERYKAEVAVGQTVQLEVEVEAFRDRRFPGVISRISPAIDRNNRTFQVEVQVPNEKRLLSAGSFVKATIVTGENAEALMVPEEAVIRFAGVTKVFVLRDDKAVQVPVILGETIEIGSAGRPRKWLEVRGDLRVNERVVTTGQTKLIEGIAVRDRGQEAPR